MWVLATATLAVFTIHRSRGADVARMLLATFQGILTSDRWGAYAWFDAAQRQLCWSHLIRDVRGFADYGDEAAQISKALPQPSAPSLAALTRTGCPAPAAGPSTS
jgi:transposase